MSDQACVSCQFRQTLILEPRIFFLLVTLVSETSVRRPANREEFIRHLTVAMKTETGNKKTKKPTIAGTAKIMRIHRDTLYEWMREFGVDFENALKGEAEPTVVGKLSEKSSYMIGEALVGEGTEVAHVDLLIGDKSGPVGEAFAQGLSNLSA